MDKKEYFKIAIVIILGLAIGYMFSACKSSVQCDAYSKTTTTTMDTVSK
jgi:hypothetical protein